MAVDVTVLGDAALAGRLLRPLTALPTPLRDTRARMSTADVGRITGDPTDPGPGSSRAELLTGLDDEAIEALLRDPIGPLMTVQVRHLDGAFAGPSDTPHGPLTEPYAAYLFGVPTDPEAARRIRARQAELAGSLPVSGRKPLCFLAPGEGLQHALPAGSLDRLRRLKAAWDPAGRIRGNVGIPG